MGKSVDRTKKANKKCQNCKYLKETALTGGVRTICSVNNTLVDAWDVCKKFQWREDKTYNDSAVVNILR